MCDELIESYAEETNFNEKTFFINYYSIIDNC